jgi:hypothetical protein
MHPEHDASENRGASSAPLPEVDYTPRKHSRAREAVYGLKLIAAAALFFLVIWLLETK